MAVRARTIAAKAIVAVAALAPMLLPRQAVGGLSDVFESPRFAHLGIAPLAPALADTVAATYPVASASSSVEFVYDPALDVVVRRPGVPGPIVGERAETLGPGRFDVDVGYSFVDLSTINGTSLHHLVNAPLLGGRVLFFPVPGGVLLRDGRRTTILPVRVGLDIGVTAHILTPSITYGVTPDLDLNVAIPFLHTALDVTTHARVPDPRLPVFALPRGDPEAAIVSQEESGASDGVGDVLLRAKYVLRRGAPADLALGLGLSLPSGRTSDFRGTGETRVEPLLIASRRLWQRLELIANAGADIDAGTVDRTVVRWALGGTATVSGPVSAAIVFLGRHELARQTSPIQFPFFFQIQRNDFYDASLELHWRFAEAGLISGNVLLPLNRDGLRADVIPTVRIEYAF